MALLTNYNVDTSNIITSAHGVYISGSITFASLLQKEYDPETLSMDVLLGEESFWLQFTRNWLPSELPEYYPSIANESISKLVDNNQQFYNLLRSLNFNLDLGGAGKFRSVKTPVNRDRSKWTVQKIPVTVDPPMKPQLIIVDDFQRPIAGYGRYDGIIEWCIYASINQEEMEHIIKLKQAANGLLAP